jgi:hypothetical protein
VLLKMPLFITTHDWKCRECSQHKWTTANLPKEVTHLMNTWEDNFEDKATLMESPGWENARATYEEHGAQAALHDALASGDQPHSHTHTTRLNKARQQLPSLQKQEDYYPCHSTRYNITIGQECRHKVTPRPYRGYQPPHRHQTHRKARSLHSPRAYAA